MDSSDENDMGEVDITLADRYFDRLMTILPRGERTDHYVAILKEEIALLDDEFAVHMDNLSFACERYHRETVY